MSQLDVVDLCGQAEVRCPKWCVTDHEGWQGEENWVHQSAPVYVTPGVTARVCISVDPESGMADGPHILIGDVEYSQAATRSLAAALMDLAATRP